MPLRVPLATLSFFVLLAAHDWPQWGGAAGRNMASLETGLAGNWDAETGRNVRWTARLGSQTYGNPVVAGGKVFLGTNNENPRDPAIRGDRGVLLALREADGGFLWQAVSDKLSTDQDFPQIGVCSSPLVEGDRLFYVSNRGELVALDTEGFRDGENDGPFLGEAAASQTSADIVWKLDMRELGVVPRFASASSPVSSGDHVFVNTGNGVGKDGRVPSPGAPSFLAVDKRTGKIAWSDASPGEGLLGGQWSSPAVGVVAGAPQVVFGGGDGWLYAFHADTGEPLWRFNGNAGASPGAQGYFVATPTFLGDRVLVGIGRDPQDGAGPGRFWALDATRRGDVTETGVLWRYDKPGRTLSAAAVADGLVFLADFGGVLHCLDLETGRPLWTHDLFAGVWGSPLVADGRVFVVDEDGEVEILRAGRQREVLGIVSLNEASHATPVAANGALFLTTASRLFAIAPDGRKETAEPPAKPAPPRR